MPTPYFNRMVKQFVIGYEMSYVRDMSGQDRICPSVILRRYLLGPSMSYTKEKCIVMLECVDKELSTSDKELSVSVYLRSRNNMIGQYKDDIIHALCSIRISCDKRTIVQAVY